MLTNWSKSALGIASLRPKFAQRKIFSFEFDIDFEIDNFASQLRPDDLPYPELRPDDLPYPELRPDDLPYPELRPDDLPYPELRPHELPYPELRQQQLVNKGA